MAAVGVNLNDHGMITSGLFSFDHLEPHVLAHLRNVYGCLSLGMLSSSVGAYIHFFTSIGEWYIMTTTASVLMIVWLVLTNHTKESFARRLGVFDSSTFLSGASLGTLLDLVVRIEPRLISTALLSSTVVFISLSLAALLNNDRKFVSMGVLLFAGLFLLMLVGFLNMYLGSRIIFDMYIYSGLILFAFFVMYDTQLVVEKRRQGQDDFIWHSVALFLDAIQIFKMLLIILAKKADGKNRTQDN